MVRNAGDPLEPRLEQRLEQRLDRWVSAGRQLVDGVSGARPGSRPPIRSGSLGRWLEDRMDWLLDDSDDWREPWQESAPARSPSPAPAASPVPAASPRRRPLEAISRRSSRPLPAQAPAPPATQAPAPRPEAAVPPAAGRVSPGRPLPRSTRRRP